MFGKDMSLVILLVQVVMILLVLPKTVLANNPFKKGIEEPLCIYTMNQTEESWCHSEDYPGNENDSPFIEPDKGGDCLPYFGFWMEGRRWTPVGNIEWIPGEWEVPVSHRALRPNRRDPETFEYKSTGELANGYELKGYFRSSCTGITGEDCSEYGVDCDFKNGEESSLLLRFRIWGEVDCEDHKVQNRFHYCPKLDTGCMDLEASKLYEWMYGDVTFASGKRLYIEHRFPGARKPAAPIGVGPGANLHNKENGVGFWFQARTFDGKEHHDGDINLDIRKCPYADIPEPGIPTCDQLNIDDGSSGVEYGSGECAYEYNSGGVNSNYLAYLRKERRAMVPSYNRVSKIMKVVRKISNEDSSSPTGQLLEDLNPAYDSRHADVMFERALEIPVLEEMIDGEIIFRGKLHDVRDETYSLNMFLKVSKARGIFSCDENGNSEHEREEPYLCPNPIAVNQLEYKDSWWYFGHASGYITKINSNSSMAEGSMDGRCSISIKGEYSPQYGYHASGKAQPYTKNKNGFALWSRLIDCVGELSNLENSQLWINSVIDTCQEPPVQAIPCQIGQNSA